MNFRFYPPGHGLKGHPFSGYSSPPGKSGDAPGPVSAHPGFAAIGVEDTHAEIVSWRTILQEKQSIRPERKLAPADLPGKNGYIRGNNALSIVNNDKVVPAGTHFSKFNHSSPLVKSS
jgi:hypothetical protein